MTKVLVVCARRYNGHELWTTLGILQQAGIKFEVISTSTLLSDEVTRRSNTIKRVINDVDPDEISQYDGLLFISGNMSDTEAYWHDKKTLAYVNQAQQLDIPLGAICCSVPTVRYAAKGKHVSFFPLVRIRQLLTEAGAILSPVGVSVDRKLVTAEHQMSSQVWAESFVKVLKGEPSDLRLTDSGWVPMGKAERRLHPRLERLRGVEYHPKNKEIMDGKIHRSQS